MKKQNYQRRTRIRAYLGLLRLLSPFIIHVTSYQYSKELITVSALVMLLVSKLCVYIDVICSITFPVKYQKRLSTISVVCIHMYVSNVDEHDC